MRFLYFYLMADDPERVSETAPRHAAYWHQLAPQGYLGGPFADRSGGLITFETETDALAREMVAEDPFLGSGLLSSWWLEPWLAEETAPPVRPPAGRP